MTGDAATVLRRVSSLPYQKLDEEVLVVDPRTREVHLLNATATRVWDLLEQPATAAQLLAVLRDEFEAPEESLRADLAALLEDLAGKGLVGSDAAVAPDAPNDAPNGRDDQGPPR